MLWVALGAGLLAFLVLLGRTTTRSSRSPEANGGEWRAIAGVLAIAAAVAALVLGARGAWPAALAFGALSGAGAVLARRPRRASPPRLGPHMSLDEARRVLGVGPEAGAEEIQAAYVRLMRRVHPDLGGAAGLAAQLNAARDALLDDR